MATNINTPHQDAFRMKRGAIDLDGVVAELSNRTIEVARAQYGCKTPLGHEFADYDMSVGTDITRAIYKEIFAADGFYRNAELMPHAHAALNELYDGGYSLNVITARPNNRHVVPDTLHWLAYHAIPLDSVHVVSNVTYEGGADAKCVIASGLGLGWAVEDSPFNAVAYARVCDVVFLVDASYNRNITMPLNVVRIRDLRDMVAYLKEDEIMRAARTQDIGMRVA